MTRRLERSFTMNDEEFVEKYTSRRRAGRYEPLTGINNDTLEGTDNNDDQITETKIPKIIEVNRIRLLTDGVIAVAITLLIVELKVPAQWDYETYLHTLYEVFGICAVTMILTGHWVTHVHVFTIVQGSDSILTFFNTLLILFICLTPFTVMVAVNWSAQFYSSLLVNLNLSMMDMMLTAIWLYATYKRRFVFAEDRLSSRDIILTTIRTCVPIILYIISIAVAVKSRYASIAVTTSVALMFVLSSFGFDFFTLLSWINRKIRKREINTQIAHSESETNFLESTEYDEMIIERLKGFADTMFSIVITILILQMHSPIREHVVSRRNNNVEDEWEINAELGRALISEELYPVYIAFTVSVILVSSYWKSHCYILSRIHRTDQIFLFANMVQLILVSFIPFTATLLGKYPTKVISAVAFNGLLVLVGLSSLWVFWVANFQNRLVYSPTAYKILANIRILSAPTIYSIAFGIAFVNTYASIGVSLIVPLLEVTAAFQLDVYRLVWKLLIWIYERRHGTTVEVASPSDRNIYRYSIT